MRGGGRHTYFGKNNQRGGRSSAKIYQGLTRRGIRKAYEELDRENPKNNGRGIGPPVQGGLTRENWTEEEA